MSDAHESSTRWGDPDAFARHAIDLLRREFPDLPIEQGEDPLVLLVGSQEVSLANPHALAVSRQLDDDALAAALRHMFQQMLLMRQSGPHLKSLTLDEAIPLLFPQLKGGSIDANTAAVQNAITREFAGALTAMLVLDTPDAYIYVRQEDVDRWSAAPDDLFDEALQNLAETSAELRVMSLGEPTHMLLVSTGDGYDAARLLLPQVRAAALDVLGDPCLAAVPNRELLIFWSPDRLGNDDSAFRRQVETDHATQPYPVSPLIFRVSADAIEPLSEP